MLPLLQRFDPVCRSRVNFFDQGVEFSLALGQLGASLCHLSRRFLVGFLGCSGCDGGFPFVG